MAVRMIDHLMQARQELRYQPTPKRVRARLGGATVVDTRDAVLVWEPRHVVPSYAVPISDVTGTLAEASDDAASELPVSLEEGGPPVIDPRTAFGFHTTAGTPMTVTAGAATGQAFRPAELDSMVILDFDGFDWLEEDEPIFGHPHDPFSRIDVRRSSTPIRIELDGRLVAESARALILFEFVLPARYYLPRADVVAALEPSPTSTVCAYKGHASHWSLVGGGDKGVDIAWSYEHPPLELAQIAGMVCFYQERVDVVLDGKSQIRPVTPWS
ncbi:DUF427 domain-containing protein [Rhodococcus oxybenzonivorans]|uniref:DUF427 domain-containing protein n=1 Tax=Rhodococcus oxybenzonivorans TaxID=1990687 RepID=UPI0029531856|nr:DUF427 domain-containing protein [Rhodococcus oxybenzonivorans]MDV7356243.1 DUF427 domain-containing protein [Rhodococcus oxybenzonivorans]